MFLQEYIRKEKRTLRKHSPQTEPFVHGGLQVGWVQHQETFLLPKRFPGTHHHPAMAATCPPRARSNPMFLENWLLQTLPVATTLVCLKYKVFLGLPQIFHLGGQPTAGQGGSLAPMRNTVFQCRRGLAHRGGRRQHHAKCQKTPVVFLGCQGRN